MLHDVVEDPGSQSEDALLAAHVDQLAGVVGALGTDAAARATGLSTDTLAAVAARDRDAAAALDIDEVAALLALADDAPAADSIASEARDALLLGMTAGVMNVDVVAGDLSIDLEPREVQGMLEGRHPMTLREFVALQRAIGRRSA